MTILKLLNPVAQPLVLFRGYIKIQVAATATVCSRLQKVAILLCQLGQFKQLNIDICCFNMTVYAYLNE